MRFNAFFVRNWQFTLVIFIAFMVLGINALVNMPRGEDPPFGAPIFSIVVVHPGTNPKDMESLIADPIEEVLYQLSDVKKINTTIKDGLVFMLTEFSYGVDVDSKNNDVIREINKIRPNLPDGIVFFDIKKAASSDVAILQTAIISDTASFATLKKEAEKLEKKIEKIKEVKWVEIQAIPEQTLKIQLDLEKMKLLQLGVNQVLGLLQANNVNIPGGSVDIDNRKYNIKTTSEYSTIDDVKNTVVNVSKDGIITTLDQIAHVFYDYEDQNHIARHNGRRAIWLLTAMKDKKNIISTRQQIQNVLDESIPELAQGVQIDQAFDQEVGVRNRLGGLGVDFAIAIFLVLLTLLPLGTRASLIVMISIPLSLCIGLFTLDLLGYTLNQLSIVGMVIALGLLVDDSIVVVENIERYMRSGISAKDAAITATNHIMVAILGCTATLLLAFLPLANLPEGSGDFIRSLPMAVMVTVMASLFVSITIIPFLASIILKTNSHHNGVEGNFFFRGFKKYINTPYQNLLIKCMAYPKSTLFIGLLLFAASLLLVPIVGFSLFPASEKPILTIDIESEPGSNITHTDKMVYGIERKIMAFPEVKRLSSNVGRGNPRIYYNEFQTQNSDNLAQLIVYLDDKAHVPEIDRVAQMIRDTFGNFPGAKIEVKRFQQGPPISAPIEFKIVGNNLDTLEKVAARVADIAMHTDGTIYVRNDLQYKQSDLVIEIDKLKAGLYGLTSGEIAKTVRLAIAGLGLGTISDTEGEDIAIQIGIKSSKMEAISAFKKISITSASGELVPLENIAKINFRPSAPVIRHFNKDRYALVSSFVQKGFNVDQITTKLLEVIQSKANIPAGYQVIAAGERESRAESFGGIGTIIILTVFGLLAILILEFRTFKSTLIVLSVIPMGIIGALLALYITGETLSFVATIGIIALMGIEIKNSILMVDYTNGLREQGMRLHEAVMDGAETRFLPILLTSMTAIGGLIPLVLENSPLISPLAIVLIGGLISSTLLSRLVTPVIYKMIPPKIAIKG